MPNAEQVGATRSAPPAGAVEKTVSDRDLVVRATAGDEHAFAGLVERYRAPAYRVALSVLERHEDAEDAIQESLTAAYQNLDACGVPDRFSGWLMTIVRNRALNILRRESLRATEAMPSQQACDTTVAPDRAAEGSELLRQVAAVLRSVPEVRRTVFLMHDVEGCTHAEIATALDLKQGTVRSHLWHARAAVREALEPLQ